MFKEYSCFSSGYVIIDKFDGTEGGSTFENWGPVSEKVAGYVRSLIFADTQETDDIIVHQATRYADLSYISHPKRGKYLFPYENTQKFDINYIIKLIFEDNFA